MRMASSNIISAKRRVLFARARLWCRETLQIHLSAGNAGHLLCCSRFSLGSLAAVLSLWPGYPCLYLCSRLPLCFLSFLSICLSISLPVYPSICLPVYHNLGHCSCTHNKLSWVLVLSGVWLFATPWTVARPGFSVHGICQARTLEYVAIPFSRGSSQPKDRTRVFHASCMAGGFDTTELRGKQQTILGCKILRTSSQLPNN